MRTFGIATAAAALCSSCAMFDSPEAVVRDASRGLENACTYYREAPNVKRSAEADRVCALRRAACDEAGGAGGEAP